MQRCEADDCIAPAVVALSVDDVMPATEVFFCRGCFDKIEQRCSAYGKQRRELINQGCSPQIADRIIGARIERRV
ncbi:hypothetical protein [Caudoviricetes sp.]|nr:hypothetical protein [Caudoviricetes sp.]